MCSLHFLFFGVRKGFEFAHRLVGTLNIKVLYIAE